MANVVKFINAVALDANKTAQATHTTNLKTVAANSYISRIVLKQIKPV